MGINASSISRIEGGKIKFPREKLPLLVAELSPHFPSPESVGENLVDALDKEDVADEVGSKLSKHLQQGFTTEELRGVNNKLDQPENGKKAAEFFKRF